MKPSEKGKLGEILVSKGYLPAESLKTALDASRKEKRRLGAVCVRLGLINERQLAEALAEQYGLEVAELKEFEVDEDLLESIPYEILHKAKVVPLRGEGVSLLATADPTDILTLDDIERLVKKKKGKKRRPPVAARA